MNYIIRQAFYFGVMGTPYIPIDLVSWAHLYIIYRFGVMGTPYIPIDLVSWAHPPNTLFTKEVTT